MTDPGSELRNLQHIEPIAYRLLGEQSRDYLTPLWRRLAAALAGRDYDRNAPDRHISHVLLQMRDFTGTVTAVLKVQGWQLEFPLCLRLTEAACYSGDDPLAISAWCYLCWHNPEQTRELPDVGKHLNPLIGRWWERFLDTEELLPLAGDMPVTDFPAWLLITVPGLVNKLPEQLPIGDGSGERGYVLVHRLIRVRHDANEAAELEFRKILSAENPGLFQYMKNRL